MPEPVTLKSTYTDLFLLDFKQETSETNITMRLLTPLVRTVNLPNTYTTLLEVLPSIFDSKCFNDKKFSFSKEVLNTEIGHLFEHILLEYLTQLKFSYDNKNVSYSGLTSWDWHKEEQGVFHIRVDIGNFDSYIFAVALEKSTKLLNKILKDHLETVN
jgi:hypothetical protein